jgi:hypothetical protein
MTGPDRTSTNTAGRSHDRGEYRSERQQEQHDDEQERQLLRLVLRGARCRDRIDLRGELAGQMDLEAGGCRRGAESGPNGIDHPLGLGAAAERDDRGLDQRLTRLAIAGDAKVDDGLDSIDASDLRLEPVDRGVIVRGQPAVACHHQRRRCERGVLKGRRHRGCLHARGTRREKAARRVLGHARERGQQLDGEDRGNHPDEHDRVAEANRRVTDEDEDAVHETNARIDQLLESELLAS